MEKYFKFAGTSTRSEYWGVTFVSLAALAVISLASVALAGIIGPTISGLIVIAALAASIWLELATSVRRCRDASINPWFTLLLFVPYIAVPACIVFGVLPTAISKGE